MDRFVKASGDARSSSVRLGVGTFAKIAAQEVCEIIARSGFDFVVIDAEHAPLSLRDVYSMVVTYSSLGVKPFVRLSDHGYGDGQRYLDAGAAGIFVPHVSNGEQARSVMRQFLFPPRGTRGMGFAARAGGWGLLPGGPAEYVRAGDNDVTRVAMVEELESVHTLEDILQADGLDAIFVGPGDLSLSMGLQLGDPELTKLVDQVIEQAVAAGVPVGTIEMTGEQAPRRADQGCSFVIVNNDTGILAKAAASTVSGARRALADAAANELADKRDTRAGT